jgi:hypothetical protein
MKKSAGKAMRGVRRVLRTAAAWAAANPAKAAELAITLAFLGFTLATTGRLERRILKRLARAVL